MIKDLTQNDLLLLAYNELPPDKHQEMMSIVEGNSLLFSQYNEIKKQMSILDTVALKPNSTSVQIVLEESCSSSSLEMI